MKLIDMCFWQIGYNNSFQAFKIQDNEIILYMQLPRINDRNIIKLKDIKLEEKTKKELYEITLRKEVVNKVESKLKEKRQEAKKILQKEVVKEEDLEKIKRIIIYSKKKSSIIISELNNETYNEENIKILLNELIKSMSSLNISGLVKVENKIVISSNTMSKIYDVIYELLENLQNIVVMIYITRKEKQIYIKSVISAKMKLKDKLKIDSNIKIKENIYDKDTEILFTIIEGDTK